MRSGVRSHRIVRRRGAGGRALRDRPLRPRSSRGPSLSGTPDIVRFVQTNLNEEKSAHKKLSTVALRKGVNRKAAS
jgi:hypothetical protein